MTKFRCTLHRYARRNRGKKNSSQLIYACQDCTHYIQPEFIVGKKCRCYHCNNEMTVLPKDKQLKFIHCLPCTKPKNVKQAESISDLLEALGVVSKEEEFVGEE